MAGLYINLTLTPFRCSTIRSNTPIELGPTEVVPGSHFLVHLQRWMGHYTGIKGAVSTAAPAGSIFLTIIFYLASAEYFHRERHP